jgi:hypothetical protein
LKKCLLKNLRELKKYPADTLLQKRYDKFRAMGIFKTEEKSQPACNAMRSIAGRESEVSSQLPEGRDRKAEKT